MACRDDGVLNEQTPPPLFVNWSREIRYRPGRVFRPRTLADLVLAIQTAEADGRSIKGYGSGWSFSNASTTSRQDYLIETCALDAVLGHKVGSVGAPPEFGEASEIVPWALLPDLRSSRTRRFVHVEAGIKVHRLNEELDRIGCAMPTLGGSAGQSLAGVISTGTHGGDVDLGLISDAVRAIHLVGTRGQEWWIERRSGRITDRNELFLRLNCSDVRIVYEDDLLRAAVLALGRMGVIYSLVLEVEAAFDLREVAAPATWQRLPFVPPLPVATVRERIESGEIFADSDSSFRFLEVQWHPFTILALERRRYRRAAGSPPQGAPPGLFSVLCREATVADAANRVLQQLVHEAREANLLERVFLGFLAALGLGPAIPGFLEIVGSVGALSGLLAPLLGLTPLLAGGLAATLSELSRGGSATLGELIANVINVLTDAGRGDLAQELLVALFASAQEGGVRVDRSYRVMDGYGRDIGYGDSPDPCGAGPDQCFKVSSLEYFFDARSPDLLEFIDRVSAAAREITRGRPPRPLAFIFALRFMRRSDALLSPARFERTCSIEIPIVQGLRATVAFRRRVEAIAQDFQQRAVPQAIPSWGQHYALSRSTVERIYGEDLERWRRALQTVSGEGDPRTFRTAFSIERGLEYDLPRVDCFIASAACGTPDAPEVVELRMFRDRVLRRSRLGRQLIARYERVSPGLASRIRDRPRVAAALRIACVKPAAALARASAIQSTIMERFVVGARCAARAVSKWRAGALLRERYRPI